MPLSANGPGRLIPRYREGAWGFAEKYAPETLYCCCGVGLEHCTRDQASIILGPPIGALGLGAWMFERGEIGLGSGDD